MTAAATAVIGIFALTNGCREEQHGWVDRKSYLDALTLYDQELWHEALLAFDQFVVEYPASDLVPDAQVKSGMCLYHLEDYNGALERLTPLASSQTSAASAASYYVGKCHFQLADYSSAVIAFKTFLDEFSTSVFRDNAFYYLGRSLEKQGRYLDAILQFNEVIADAKSSFRDAALYHSGSASSELSYQNGAVDLEDYQDAEARLSALFSDYPGSIYEDDGLLVFGLCRYRGRDYPTAVMRFDDLLNRFPTSVRADNAAYYKAKSFYKQGLFNDAIGLFLNFIDTYSESIYVDDSVYFSGRCHFEIAVANGDDAASFEQAIVFFEEIVASHPQSNWVDNAYYYEILALIYLNRCPEAEAKAQELSAAQPDSSYIEKAQDELASECP
jgi:TolA-binding protein